MVGKKVPATVCAISDVIRGEQNVLEIEERGPVKMMQTPIDLNDADLLARMRNFEDHFVERKTVKDEKDWRKTAVAFANSVPIGLPAVLYIGVKNNGEIEAPQPNLDEIQRKFDAQMQRVYPRVAYVPKIITDNRQHALAVIIPGSDLRPHFAGLSYVRRGSESVEASDEKFAELIAQRNSKAALIMNWKGQNVMSSIEARRALRVNGLAARN